MNASASQPMPLPSAGVIELGDLTIDLGMRALRRGGETIAIGSRAYDILVVLALAEGRLVTKDELMSAVWPRNIVEENNIQVHLSGLRKILGADRDLIVTVPGRGYKLIRREGNAPASRTISPTRGIRASNVRASRTRLVGREDDMERVLALLRDTHLLNIVGAGGVGKSSLAVEVARQFERHEGQQVWLASFASVTNREAALDACLAMFGLTSHGRSGGIEQLAASVADANGLILLDNVEHLVADIAAIADRLLFANPQLRILVTSRAPLRIVSEKVYRLGPLASPLPHATDSEIAASPAVRLFRDRADALQTALADDPQQLRVMGDICRRLDGNPLAIELAATRLSALGLKDLQHRLDDQLAVLTGGYRTALPRHRSLRATLDWSHSLLSPDQAAVFRRICIFSDTFDFDAMCAVACDDALSVEHVIDCVGELAARSLLSVQFVGPLARYQIAESERCYGRELLADSGELNKVRAHHARFVCDQLTNMASRHEPDLAFLRETLIDARDALDWAFSADGHAGVGIELSAVLVDVCLKNEKIDECIEYAMRAIDVIAELPSDSIDAAVRTRLLAAVESGRSQVLAKTGHLTEEGTPARRRNGMHLVTSCPGDSR